MEWIWSSAIIVVPTLVVLFFWIAGLYEKLKELEKKLKEVKAQKDTELELANEIQKKSEQLTEKYITLDQYDQEDSEYLAGIREIALDSRFRFFIFDIEQEVLKLFKEAPTDKALEIQGLIRGIEYVKKELTKRVIKYNQKVSNENV